MRSLTALAVIGCLMAAHLAWAKTVAEMDLVDISDEVGRQSVVAAGTPSCVPRTWTR